MLDRLFRAARHNYPGGAQRYEQILAKMRRQLDQENNKPGGYSSKPAGEQAHA
jgi:hypothetical protein